MPAPASTPRTRVACLALGWLASLSLAGCVDTYEVEREDVTPPQSRFDLQDDSLESKQPAFDPTLIDSRPLGPQDAPWELNASAAVVALDVLDSRSDAEGLERLYPSYAAAYEALAKRGYRLLPSINVLDGKAKQFDDGLYAAIELETCGGQGKGEVQNLRALLERLEKRLPAGKARGWVRAARVLGGAASPTPEARHALDRFEQNAASKVIGFYTWSEELRQAFRMLRFLMQDFRGEEDPRAQALLKALEGDAEGLARYRRLLALYERLTNPYSAPHLLDLQAARAKGQSLSAYARARGYERQGQVHFLPACASKETTLFNRLFGQRLPQGKNLMLELIRAVRSGKVDLAPRKGAGWYEHQVHALETFLLPTRGPEGQKLLLKKKYKERMLQAFQALITKRRETHVRAMDGAKTASAREPDLELAPRLRLEPCPTYYLRTARAYAFVEAVLRSQLGAKALARLHGQSAAGPRQPALGAELAAQRELFYGFYVLSCEDLGMRPRWAKGERVDLGRARAAAAAWLKGWWKDPDLAQDTRVSVPILSDLRRRKLRLWATLGVRAVQLQASYARAPKWRPRGRKDARWQEVPRTARLKALILVDEFAEVERPSLTPLSRKELRALCDRGQTKEGIVKLIEAGS